MAATTGQLGLVTPTQGDLSGVWGDTVNNGITEYTNIAIAGTLTLTGDGAVTLQNTTGNNTTSNITSTLTGAGTVTAQFAIVRVTGTLTTAKVVTGPSYSKTYLVVNAATGSTVSFIRSGQTPAISIAVGESALVYFNGTDYVKVAGTTSGAAAGSNTQVQFNSSGVLAGSANLTFNGTTLTANTIGAFTLSGTIAGGGNQINNVIIGTSTPLAGAFTTLSASGATTLSAQLTASTGDGSYPIISKDTRAFSAGVTGPQLGFFGLDSTSTNNALGALRALAQTAQNGTLEARVMSSGSITTIGTFSSTGLAVTGTLSATGNATFSGGTATVNNLVNTVGQAATLNLTTFNTNFGSSNTLQLLTTLNNATTGASTSTFKQFNHNQGSDDVFITKTSGDAGYLAFSTGTSATEHLRIASTGAFGLSGANYGTSGQVLTSGGSGAAPTWTTPSGGGSAATPTALGTVYGKQTTSGGTPYLTAYGYNAGLATTGVGCTAVGVGALTTNTSGANHTAIGYRALLNSTLNDNSTAVGFESMLTTTTGNECTAVGYRSLYSQNSGYFNTAIGVQAAYNLTSGTSNTAVGHKALFTNLIGENNTALGFNALYGNTDYNNTAVGHQSLYTNSTGANNTAVGFEALKAKTTAASVVAVGSYAGNAGATGSYGTYVGVESGFNVTGVYNTAIGYRSINAAACTGSYNSGLGANSLYGMTSGSYNVGVGNEAGYTNTTGSYNVAVGGDALRINATGVYNTAIGYKTLQVQTGTGYNTALGFAALSSVTTGTNNTGIGYNGGADAGVIDITTQSDRVAIGNTSITNAYIRVAWTVTSDARDKTQITPVPHGLSFVNQLNPVAFKFRKSRTDDTPIGDVRYGFLAQDILAIEGSDSVVIDSADANNLKYIDQNMTAILVKAIQELKAEFDAYKASHP